MKRTLFQSPGFTRALRRIAKRNQAAVPEILATLEQLENDAYAPALKTHKLQGDLAGSMSCSVAYDLRIIFRFFNDDDAESILLLSIGTHDEVY